jgi:hypothetical protein
MKIVLHFAFACAYLVAPLLAIQVQLPHDQTLMKTLLQYQIPNITELISEFNSTQCIFCNNSKSILFNLSNSLNFNFSCNITPPVPVPTVTYYGYVFITEITATLGNTENNGAAYNSTSLAQV